MSSYKSPKTNFLSGVVNFTDNNTIMPCPSMQAIGSFLDAIDPNVTASSMADLDQSLNTDLVASVADLSAEITAFGQYGPPGSGHMRSMREWLEKIRDAPTTLNTMQGQASDLRDACNTVAGTGAK
jgi:hypothetical protein